LDLDRLTRFAELAVTFNQASSSESIENTWSNTRKNSSALFANRAMSSASSTSNRRNSMAIEVSTLEAPATTKRAPRPAKTYTVGSYLAARFTEIGLKHHFAVAGDYNLALLDQLLSNKQLKQIYCSNELNCGFAAEGYARANGAAAAVVTFSVGALSAFNALGGAYAENLPVILVSGAPNTNDRATDHLLHHTLGTHDFSYQLEIAKKLTCAAVSITSPARAPEQIGYVIRTALRERKPAYIEIACNIAAVPRLVRSVRSLGLSQATRNRFMLQ
jgi:TPP-dependent 2-oxoacid decarboxylase